MHWDWLDWEAELLISYEELMKMLKLVHSDPDSLQHKNELWRHLPVKIIVIFWKFNPEIKK